MKISVVLLTLFVSVYSLEVGDIPAVNGNEAVEHDIEKIVEIVRYRQTVCVVYGENITASLLKQKSDLNDDNNSAKPVEEQLQSSNQDSECESIEDDRSTLQLISPIVIKSKMRVRYVYGDVPNLTMFLATPQTLYWGNSNGEKLPITPMIYNPNKSENSSIITKIKVVDSPVTVTFHSKKYYLGAEFPICKNSEVKNEDKSQGDVTSVTEAPSTTTEESVSVTVSPNVKSVSEKTRVRRTLKLSKKISSALVSHILHMLVNKPDFIGVIPPKIIAEIADNPRIIDILINAAAESQDFSESQQFLESSEDQYNYSPIESSAIDPSLYVSARSNQKNNNVANKFNFVIDRPSLVVPNPIPALKNALLAKLGALSRLRWPGDCRICNKRRRRSINMNQLNGHEEVMEKSALSVNVKDKKELHDISFKPENDSLDTPDLHHVNAVPIVDNHHVEITEPPKFSVINHLYKPTEKPLLDVKHDVIKNPAVGMEKPSATSGMFGYRRGLKAVRYHPVHWSVNSQNEPDILTIVHKMNQTTQAVENNVTISPVPTVETPTTDAIPTEAPSSTDEVTDEAQTTEAFTTVNPAGINLQDVVVFTNVEVQNGSLDLASITAGNVDGNSLVVEVVQSKDPQEESKAIADAITSYDAEPSSNAASVLQDIVEATLDIVGDIEDPDEDSEDDA